MLVRFEELEAAVEQQCADLEKAAQPS
jgi:hypothetical protein